MEVVLQEVLQQGIQVVPALQVPPEVLVMLKLLITEKPKK